MVLIFAIVIYVILLSLGAPWWLALGLLFCM